MPHPLVRGHENHIADELRPGADHAHIAFQDIKCFGQFVQARRAERFAETAETFFVRKQVSVGIASVGHGAELVHVEDALLSGFGIDHAGPGLFKQNRAAQLDADKDRDDQIEPAKESDGQQSAYDIEKAFYVFFIKPALAPRHFRQFHYSKHLFTISTTRSTSSAVILLSLGRHRPLAKMSAPASAALPRSM